MKLFKFNQFTSRVEQPVMSIDRILSCQNDELNSSESSEENIELIEDEEVKIAELPKEEVKEEVPEDEVKQSSQGTSEKQGD